MKKLILILVVLILNIQVGICAPAPKAPVNKAPVKIKIIQKEIEVETKDAHIMKATLTYQKTKAAKLPTIVLLHSLGYNSSYWQDLIPTLNKKGYAVLAIDLRGHGKSIYSSSFRMKSWTYFTTKTFAKYPDDVIAIMNETQKMYKKTDFTNYAIIGADIGANTAVLVTKKYNKKPKALVLISPLMTFKGLYIPVAMTEIGKIPILTGASLVDVGMIKEQEKLSKFAQGDFYIQNYQYGGTGMLMLKANPSMSQNIVKWLGTFVK